MEVLIINKIKVYCLDQLKNEMLRKLILLTIQIKGKTLIYIPNEKILKFLIEELKGYNIDSNLYTLKVIDCNVTEGYDNYIFYNISAMEEYDAVDIATNCIEIFNKAVYVLQSIEDKKKYFKSNKCIVYGSKEIVYQIPSREELYIKMKKRYKEGKVLYGKDIDKAVICFINFATRTLFMSCPWFNEIVLRNYKEHIRLALERGVEVTIYYGYTKKDSRLESTERAIINFTTQFASYNNLKVKFARNHAVLIIADEDYCINSSKNTFSCDDSPANEIGTVMRNFTKKKVEELCNILDTPQ